MKRLFLIAAVLAFGVAGVASGHAAVVYNNPYGNDGGDCSFNTTCAADAARGDDYGAQLFALAGPNSISSASFTTLDCCGPGPTSANWLFLANSGGLPGAILASGSSPIASAVNIGSSDGYALDQYTFGVGPVTLGAGSYFFAVQAVTATFENYLGGGAASSGAAETHDGGATWGSLYEGLPSVAVGLYGNPVPEPASLALLGVALAGVGAIRRRR